MDIEKGRKINNSAENKPQTLEDNRSPIEAISDKIKEIDGLAEDLIISSQKKIDDVGKKLRLPDSVIDSIWREVDMPAKQDEIAMEADMFAGKAKENLLDALGDLPEIKEPSPIQGGEVFSPQDELKVILKAPRTERIELLRKYKEKLAYQKEGLAKMQEEIISEIRRNPNASLGDLYEWVRNYGDTHGLTGEQKGRARDLLRAYDDRHRAIRANREKYPTDPLLFKAVFGQEPKGEVEVIEGPITFYFRCHDPVDYALISSRAFAVNKSVTAEDIESAKREGGASIEASKIPELKGSIIAENSSTLREDYHRILDHEEQHAIKKLFGKVDRERAAQERLVGAHNDKERLSALRDWLRAGRENKADERAKDEMLAYFIGQKYTAEKIVKTLTKTKEKGGLYDYMADRKELAVKAMVRLFGEEFEDTAKEEVQRIFVDDYNNLIEEGARALEALHKAGYSEQRVMAILVQEPLVHWKKVVDRLLEEKKSR